MGFTQKQERNGANIGSADGGSNTAQPGPMPPIPMAAAQSAAETRAEEGHQFMILPQGSGVAGHEIGGYGAMFEWDAGLAIGEEPGEM